MRNLQLSSIGLFRSTARALAGPLAVGVGAMGFGAMLSPSEAGAQTVGDLKLRQPNMMLLIDTSGSMNASQSGGAADCTGDDDDDDDDDDDGEKTRWVILAETLTGTVNNLDCTTSGTTSQRLTSNGCTPRSNSHPSITSALAANPYSWPFHGGGGKNKLAVGFRDGGSWCDYLKPGEWDQQNDGVIDTFADKIRFGLMTFDAFEYSGSWGWNLPLTEFLPWAWYVGQTHRNAYTTGGTNTQASYWFESPANNWLLGPPTGYAGNTYLPSAYAQWFRDNLAIDGFGVCTTYPAAPTQASGYFCPQTSFDVGAKAPHASPWLGRMIGFGDPEASVTDTIVHNDMVQLAVLGVTRSLVSSTPLAAMMRDTYEFLLNDTQTDGVTIPHLYTDPPPLIKIGPRQDTYVFGAERGCRQQYVLAITDGEPFGDIVGTTMGYWAEKLYTDSLTTYSNPVETFIIGVGMDTAQWTPGAPADTTTLATKDCADLVDADRAAGGMCERSSLDPTQWRYADECTPSGPVYNGAGPDCVPGNADDTLPDADRSAIRACCNILDVAIRGRDPAATDARPYFPKTQAELKTMMADLISKIAGGTLSRTTPVFSTASASSVVGGAAANSYEVRSALTVASGNGLWVGSLERIRWTCAAGTIDMEPADGDDFAANLAQGAPNARRFFTVSVDDKEGNPEGSVRPRQTSQSSPDPNTYDCLYECGNNEVGDTWRLGGATGPGADALQQLTSLKTALDSVGGGLNAEKMLDLRGSDKNGCEAVVNNGSSLGGGWKNTCASAILEWYGGHPDPTGPSTPTRHPDPTGVELRSPLGGIYKSVPIIVEPPKAVEEDELFANERTAPAPDTDSFVKEYGARPTMVYAQSVDGQLHAFVLSANATSGPWGAPANIPSVDSLANNELWTFIPPAIMPALFRNFDVHARLADGPITWANVAFSRDPSNGSQVRPWRTMTDVQNARGEYKTILVVSSGPSVLGGFYYALDVTDPKNPRFLWQLSSAGDKKNERKDLFGDAVPAAAITTLRLKEAHYPAGEERMVPVAILAGGSVNAAPATVKNRNIDPTDSDNWYPGYGHRPRTQIRDWGDNVAARSVTVVELYSGRVIMRIGGKHCDTAVGACTVGDVSDHPLTNGGASILNANVMLPKNGDPFIFDSPMSGTPVVYPSGVGKVATRVYVGDQDGAMWRINVSDPDPTKWSALIAFDGYNDDTMADARVQVGAGSTGPLGTELGTRGIGSSDFPIAGQPILTAPVVSTDQYDQATISFSTGNAETFQLASTNAINVVVSFVDYFEPVSKQFRPYVNQPAPADPSGPYQGIEMAFLDGAAVTGPLNLFDGQLIFAYFVPGAGSSCTFGQGGWCAAHYLEHVNPDVPDPVMDLDGVAGFDLCDDFTGPGYTGNEVVFGIQVNQKPSCQPPPVNFPDPWLAGSYSSITTSTPGAYEIVMHTGQGGATENASTTKTARKSLNTPRSQTFVRSWVNAIE